MRETELRHLVDARTHRPEVIAAAAQRRTPARSLVIGRSLLFPPDDVAAAVDAVVEML